MASSGDIPMSEQHEFLDLAKEFSWSAVKARILERPELVAAQPCGRWSALHQAAYGADENAVRFLLQHHAPVGATTRDGKTPLDVSKSTLVASILRDFANGHGQDLQVECAKGPEEPMAMKKFKVATKSMKVAKYKNLGGKKIAKGKRSKTLVYKGLFQKTVSGLTKDKLTRSKTGKIVSRAKQECGKKAYANIQGWIQAFLQARSELGLSGFVPVTKGSPLYDKAMALYRK
jgi:hypothetical protein